MAVGILSPSGKNCQYELTSLEVATGCVLIAQSLELKSQIVIEINLQKWR
jgi:hypothetical protein